MRLLESDHQTLWSAAEEIGIGPDIAMGVETVDQTPRTVVRYHLQRYAAEHAAALEGLVAAPFKRTEEYTI